MDINNGILNGKKVTPDIFSPLADMFDDCNNDYKEWLVEIEWLTPVHLEQTKASGVCFGMFKTQAITCSLDNQVQLKLQLQKVFNVDFDMLLNNSVIVEEDDEISFLEGKERYRIHIYKERDKALIKAAKERHLQNDSTLSCQVCGFSFIYNYGELGKGYIEAHHTFPISELTKETETKIEDIALVCSNCHRMLHRKRPWQTTDNLKTFRLSNHRTTN